MTAVFSPKVPRLCRLMLGDIRFQAIYGFYFLYAVITAVYILILSLMPASVRDWASPVIIFTDPSILGLVFMGAIVLYEKSERSLGSLAVSPVRPDEYVLSKALSLSVISTLSGLAITFGSAGRNVPSVFSGVFAGSVFFSFLGIFVASYARSLNHFFLLTAPAALFFLLPPITESLGFSWMFFNLHPGNVILRLISGRLSPADFSLANGLVPNAAVFLLWCVPVFFLARRRAAALFADMEGILL